MMFVMAAAFKTSSKHNAAKQTNYEGHFIKALE